MEINNLYDQVDSDYYLPKESNVKYYVKDAKLSKWLNKDISSAIGVILSPSLMIWSRAISKFHTVNIKLIEAYQIEFLKAYQTKIYDVR